MEFAPVQKAKRAAGPPTVYTKAEATMFDSCTSLQGARLRMAEVNSRAKPSRSGSIQHMVPVAPVWPKARGLSSAPQLPEVPG